MSTQAQEVYTGFWINWSYGSIDGSTITLSSRSSAYFVAFIALFVRLVGSHLWAVISFIVSLSRSTTEPQDALYHQQQAILRNSSSPATVTWGMIKLSWFWKASAQRARSRTLTFVFSGQVYIAAFAAAGIFSSKISSADSEVLLLPIQDCGLWAYPYTRLLDPAKYTFQTYQVERFRFWANMNQLYRSSHAYVSQCHEFDAAPSNESAHCLPLGKDYIKWSTELDVACPFGADLCIADAVRFVSGFLSSHTHLGINSKEDRVEYRRVTTCAPITTDGHVSGYVDVDGLNYTAADGGFAEGETFLKYAYGQSGLFGDNTTYAYSNLTFQVSVGYWIESDIYKIDTETSAANPDDPNSLLLTTFTALPSLSRPDADTALIFLSMNATSLVKIDDPWFRSTTKVLSVDTTANGSELTLESYERDAPVNVVACTEQHQLRNPTTGATSRLGGAEVGTYPVALALGFNDNQMLTFNRSFTIGTYTGFSSVFSNLGGSELLANANQYSYTTTSLPPNQWQIEFDHFFGVVLNTIQLWSQQYVSGQDPENTQYVARADDGFEAAMCNNQIVRRTDYRSFSMLGTGIILAVGFFIVLTNLTIAMIVERWQAHTVKGRYRNAEWQANDFLQLQRMAYQHNNMGTWVGQRDMVPRTTAGEVFPLPESTNWNEERVPKRPPKGRPEMSGSWSRRFSSKPKRPPSPAVESVPESTQSETCFKEKPSLPPTPRDPEKSIHFQVTESGT